MPIEGPGPKPFEKPPQIKQAEETKKEQPRPLFSRENFTIKTEEDEKAFKQLLNSMVKTIIQQMKHDMDRLRESLKKMREDL